MPTQDTTPLKEKIISVLKAKGPSLPARIAREIEQSILFTSAFLSELLSEKKIKISNMKVGSSPIYFLPGQEPKLENFSQYLKSREKDAFQILKEKKILSDREQVPAIRVALRNIQDFAIPFKKPNSDEIFWRYFTAKEEIPKEEKSEQPKSEPQVKKEKELEIFDKEPKKKKTTNKKSKKKKQSSKKNQKFFNKVKEFLISKSTEILDIESFNKNELIMKIKDSGKDLLLVAYNKKRIDEEDIVKAYKKALESNLDYKILSMGEPLKKTRKLIDAIEKLDQIEKINEE